MMPCSRCVTCTCPPPMSFHLPPPKPVPMPMPPPRPLMSLQLDEPYDGTSSPNSQVIVFQLETKHTHCVVLSGVPEAPGDVPPYARSQYDRSTVEWLFNTIGAEGPVVDVYRLGGALHSRHNPRNLKLVFTNSHTPKYFVAALSRYVVRFPRSEIALAKAHARISYDGAGLAAHNERLRSRNANSRAFHPAPNVERMVSTNGQAAATSSGDAFPPLCSSTPAANTQHGDKPMVVGTTVESDAMEVVEEETGESEEVEFSGSVGALLDQLATPVKAGKKRGRRTTQPTAASPINKIRIMSKDGRCVTLSRSTSVPRAAAPVSPARPCPGRITDPQKHGTAYRNMANGRPSLEKKWSIPNSK